MSLLRIKNSIQTKSNFFNSKSNMSKELTKEAEKKIADIQLIEQNMQNSLMQKQRFQSELLEVENALGEIESSEETYKIVGNIMISAKKDDLKKELDSKKNVLNIRIKSLEKEESRLKDKTNSLQKEVMEIIKNEQSEK